MKAAALPFLKLFSHQEIEFLYSKPTPAEEPHPLCLLAIEELQVYLQNQTDWEHNFGLKDHQIGPIIGKMFGVLVVKNPEHEMGYLSAFSGKLAESNTFERFVPPIFDTLAEDGFLSEGMKEIGKLSVAIKDLKEEQPEGHETYLKILRQDRKSYSIALQNKLFDHYHFLNRTGEEKSLIDIFNAAGYKNPPAGAGECAAPKLLQYAFKNQLTPLYLAEFWWGQSPKSATWKHKQLYTPCKEKCEPILAHMLKGV